MRFESAPSRLKTSTEERHPPLPQSLSSIGEKPVPKALILATAKVGKTTTIAKTATNQFGPGYVACSSSVEHLRGALVECQKAGLQPPEFDMIKSIDDIEACIKAARNGVKDGKYKWVMFDDFGVLATMVLEAYVASTKGDGRKYWDQYTRYVSNVVLRLIDLKCPVFVTMHYYETGAEMDGQVAKSGPGIVPAVQGGTLRQFIPGQFNQVIWMERRGSERVFRLSVEGVTGPGCNNINADITDIQADVGELVKALSGEATTPVAKAKR